MSRFRLPLWLAAGICFAIVVNVSMLRMLRSKQDTLQHDIEALGGQFVPAGRQVALIDRLRGAKEKYIVNLMGTSADDQWFRDHAEITSVPLEGLYLAGTSVSDDTLALLADAGSPVEHLELATTRVTDAGMPHLARLPSLNGVRLYETAVTDAGLAMLCKQPGLQHLDVSKCAITDAGLESICQRNNWLGLNLGGTRVTDAGLPMLNSSTSLLTLALTKTQTGDAVVDVVSQMPQLLSLEVGVHFTDAGLQRLVSACPQLGSLRLTGTRVTDAAVRRFQQLRPGVQIDHPLFEEDAKRAVGAKR